MKFDLVRPCNACPFAAVGSIELRPGRIPGIIEHLKDDFNCFPCHKTTHGAAKEEQACMGALAYMHFNHSRLPVLARLAIAAGDTSLATITAVYPLLKKPEDVS